MECLASCLLLFIYAINGGTSCLFKKLHHQKLALGITARYTVKGALDCEKICLELGESCQFVNVIYEGGRFFCDVIRKDAPTDSEFGNLLVNNPNGKLIIKQEIPLNCKINPCHNGGACLDAGLGYKCNCLSHSVGVNCQIMSLFNLTRLPHTTCTASSTYPDYPCTLAIDGLVADNKEWASMGEKDGAWINIIFPGPVLIKTIKIWPRCALYDQFRTLVFEFSDGSHAKITAHCSTNRDFRNCDDPDLLISFDLTAYVVTKWVKLTGYDSCDPTIGNNGFMELIYLGMVLFD